MLFTLKEATRLIGCSAFEILIHVVSILVFTILATLKVMIKEWMCEGMNACYWLVKLCARMLFIMGMQMRSLSVKYFLFHIISLNVIVVTLPRNTLYNLTLSPPFAPLPLSG